ncbi:MULTISPECIES: GNAT family N-acetyltransferase [unclassified Sedimentibacter]|uniref:GNAT family N-acetyltransferase n=1 Tax=unclassified Sedimentibacter TaxID=2649220 RepID=UPI0027DFC2AA|nr:GNAT family N-acetyltransferase [Sedimentibacter sp. MB35-C1]WMJ77310.1 GNAT family N-acetyltransferase [Sedimentibacter sp. MB35-C1]
MNRLKLVLPNVTHKGIILDYKEEFIINKDSMDGTAGLSTYKTFEEWYEAFNDNLHDETVREGLVSATTYLALDENEKLIGMIDIRHRLNDNLLNFGGHVGYSVRKSERRKGFATEMLKLALEKCVELNIKEVLITCDKNNIASAKTIIANGGILENEVFDQNDNTMTQRYWVTLS